MGEKFGASLLQEIHEEGFIEVRYTLRYEVLRSI